MRSHKGYAMFGYILIGVFVLGGFALLGKVLFGIGKWFLIGLGVFAVGFIVLGLIGRLVGG